MCKEKTMKTTTPPPAGTDPGTALDLVAESGPSEGTDVAPPNLGCRHLEQEESGAPATEVGNCEICGKQDLGTCRMTELTLETARLEHLRRKAQAVIEMQKKVVETLGLSHVLSVKTKGVD